MSALGSHALPFYIACVLSLLGAYAIYRRRRVTDLTSGSTAHFEPMVQTGAEALKLVAEK
jgi:hypothetical protein